MKSTSYFFGRPARTGEVHRLEGACYVRFIPTPAEMPMAATPEKLTSNESA